MDRWVISQSSASGGQDQTIKLVECPQCKTPVRSTKRYNGVINRQLKQVEAVKQKLRGQVSLILKVLCLYFRFIFLIPQDSVDSRRQMQTDILKAVRDEVGRKNAEEEAIYTKEEIKEISAKIKRFLAPKNILTLQHLQNLSQVVRHLMDLENFLKKIAAFFPKLIVKLDGTNHEAQLKLKFLTSLGRVQVQIQNILCMNFLYVIFKHWHF